MLHIIMLVKDRPKLTKQALNSLYANTANVFNLVIVDDASRELPRMEFPAEHCQVLTAKESVGTARSRNAGAVVIAEKFDPKPEDFFYQTDNDAYFKQHWDSALIANFLHAEKLDFRLLGGYNHPYQHPSGWEHGSRAGVMRGVCGFELHEHYAVGSFSWLMRWSTWMEYGPLPPTRPNAINQGDDVQFGNLLREAGYRIGAIWPHVVLNCGVTDSFGKPSPGAEFTLPEIKKHGVYYE